MSESSFNHSRGKFLLQAGSVADFGNSWALDQENCVPDPGTPDPCAEGSDERQSAEDACNELIDEYGELFVLIKIKQPSVVGRSNKRKWCKISMDELPTKILTKNRCTLKIK